MEYIPMPSLSELIQKFAEAKERRCRQRQITKADEARVIFWFHEACMRAGVRRPYGLEHLAKPESFGQNEDGLPYHGTQFAKYQRGIHRPHRSTVDKVEAVAPGSKKSIEHVLWKALSEDEKLGENATRWLRQLEPSIQSIVFKRGEDVLALQGERFLGMLERRASLDALAALTILTRLRLEQGHAKQAWCCALATYRVLLMLGNTFHEHGVAPRIVELYKTRIFDIVRWDDMRLDIPSSDFAEKVTALYDIGKLRAGARREPVSWHEHVRAMREILLGKVRFDWYFWLRALEVPDTESGPPSADTLRRSRFLQLAQDWGRHHIGTRNCDPGMPDKLFQEAVSYLPSEILKI
ncbi:MAG TPA: hypothetical protein VF450_20150 [Noviherbaspirillum sp.]